MLSWTRSDVRATNSGMSSSRGAGAKSAAPEFGSRRTPRIRRISINASRPVSAMVVSASVAASGFFAASARPPSAWTIIKAHESKGFVAKLDYYILEQVCKFHRRCLDEGRTCSPISNNFSRVHLFDLDFPARIAEVVDKYRLPYDLIEIELTETAFLVGKDTLQTMVRRLHERGFRVAIDDFGTGYSSLTMLKDVDVDIIKLDRAFLANCTQDPRAAAVIEHTLRLAQEMDIATVAEGVETIEELNFLRNLGCDMIQGYYYSRPLPEEASREKYL